MPTDRSLISLSDLVRRAAAIVDPGGDDPAVVELVMRFEDNDGHRLDEYEDDDAELLRLAARAEFDGRPPERVTAWLEERNAAP